MSQPKYRLLIRALQERIHKRVYPPGSKLPGHLVLAQEFGVSPITSNRALVELQHLGLVQRRERSGTFVLESPKTLTDILIIVGHSLSEENLQLMEHWRGVVARAEQDGVSIHTVTVTDPKLPELLQLDAGFGRGAILFGDVVDSMAAVVHNVNMPCVHLGKEFATGRFCVLEDRRRAARELTQTMIEDGCRRIGFVGSWTASNHRLARDGYLEAVLPLQLGHRYLRDAHNNNVAAIVSDLLADDLSLDGIVIMGGHLPVAALPAVIGCPRPIKLGVMTENTTVLQLRNIAYVAYYSQFETGKMAYELLKKISAASIASATTCYPPFTILRPGQQPPSTSGQYHCTESPGTP